MWYISKLLNHFKWFIYFWFIASGSGYIEVVKELLDRGANIEEKDNSGMNPLIWGIFLQLFNYFKWFIYFWFIASDRGHIEVVKELLDRGANIEEKDNSGMNPLIWGIFLNNSIILNDSFIFYLKLLGRATLKWLKNY